MTVILFTVRDTQHTVLFRNHYSHCFAFSGGICCHNQAIGLRPTALRASASVPGSSRFPGGLMHYTKQIGIPRINASSRVTTVISLSGAGQTLFQACTIMA